MKATNLMVLSLCFFFHIAIAGSQTFSKKIVNGQTLRGRDFDIAARSNSNSIGFTEIEVQNDFRQSVLLVSSNPGGTVLHAFSYHTNDSAYSISCQQLLPLANGDLLISGIYSPNNSPPYSPFVMSVDSNGDVNWGKKLDISNASSGPFLEILSDSSILCVLSYYNGSRHKLYSRLSISGGFSDFYEINHLQANLVDVLPNINTFDLLLSDGNLINVENDLSRVNWQKKYLNEIGIAINRAANKDYLIASAKVSFPGHMTVSRIDTAGNVVWSKYIETWLGSTSFPFDVTGFHFISETPEKNILVGARSEGGIGGSLLLKLDSNGNYISNSKSNSFYNKMHIDNIGNLILGGFMDIGPFNTSDFVFNKLPMEAYLACDTSNSYQITAGNEVALTADSIYFTPSAGFTAEDIFINRDSVNIDQQNHCEIKLAVFEWNVPKPTVIVSPNPSRDQVHIRAESTVENIQLIDIYGKLIGSFKHEKIDIRHLQKGTYILKVEIGGAVVSKKLIKN